MIVAGVWTGVGFANLKYSWTRIQKFWNRSGFGVWNSDFGNLWCKLPGFVHRCLRNFVKITLTRVIDCDSSRVILWKPTRFESTKILTRVTLSPGISITTEKNRLCLKPQLFFYSYLCPNPDRTQQCTKRCALIMSFLSVFLLHV